MTAANGTEAARWYGVNGTRYNESDPTGNQGAYGGAFTHFYFEGLNLGYNETVAFDYAAEKVLEYALAVIKPYGLYQDPQKFEQESNTWNWL